MKGDFMSSKNPRFSFNGDGKHSDPPPHSEPPPTNQRKKQAVEVLGKRYKELNKLWENAEADLKEIPVPVDVKFCYESVSADPKHTDEYQIHLYLGFVRSKGGWRICFGYQHETFPEDGFDWKPITECRVDIRLEAVPHIGKLRELVLKAAEDCVPTLDKAIADFRTTVESW
jgi:hypothetical protein